jgi:hypothetical protein
MVEKPLIDILNLNFEEQDVNFKVIQEILDMVKPTFSKHDEYKEKLQKLKGS